jgi:hypothetical protein
MDMCVYLESQAGMGHFFQYVFYGVGNWMNSILDELLHTKTGINRPPFYFQNAVLKVCLFYYFDTHFLILYSFIWVSYRVIIVSCRPCYKNLPNPGPVAQRPL